MNTKVSIVIPTYNAESFIRECIKSIQDQTYDNIEIIISDDASKDSTIFICEEISKHSKQDIIIIRHTENHGPMYERIEGIKQCTGEYIVFCDADDRLPKNAISTLIKHKADSNLDLVIGNFAMTYDGVQMIPNKNRLKSRVYKQDELMRIQIDDGTLSGILISNMCGKLYVRDKILKIVDQIDPSVRVNEDGMFNTYYLMYINGVLVIDEITYIQRRWKKAENLRKFSYNGYYKECDNAIKQLKKHWADSQNFDLQFIRRRTTECFWQCLNASRLLPFGEAYRYVSRELKKLHNSFDFGCLDYTNMRSYKKMLVKLMKYRMSLVFIIICRWIAPVLRKKIAR